VPLRDETIVRARIGEEMWGVGVIKRRPTTLLIYSPLDDISRYANSEGRYLANIFLEVFSCSAEVRKTYNA
jgi:hypothetical protein